MNGGPLRAGGAGGAGGVVAGAAVLDRASDDDDDDDDLVPPPAAVSVPGSRSEHPADATVATAAHRAAAAVRDRW